MKLHGVKKMEKTTFEYINIYAIIGYWLDPQLIVYMKI